MRFLIVGVSLLFSFIFYLFYAANLGKNIFFQNSENVFYGKTLLWSFIYFPILFLFLAVFFFFTFKWNKKIEYSWEEDLETEIEEIGPVQNNITKLIKICLLVWIILWSIFYFFDYNYLYLLIAFSSTILVHFCCRILYKNHKIPNNIYVWGNIFSIIYTYLFSIGSIFYIYFVENFLLFTDYQAILFYVWIGIMSFFHLYIHIRYTNIISLLIWVITFIFSLYSIIDNLFPWII